MTLQEVLAKFKKVFVKRKYKDVLFRFVFREKKELLQLYNAMNHTNYENPDELNQELLDNCKRLHDYSYFVSCVRGYLREGCSQKEAVVRATEECIQKGILKDVLVKHRAEVVDMFLTTFDKKMYKKALLEEGERNKLIYQIQKKLEKGKSVEVIATELEETVDTVAEIIDEIQK